MSDLRVCPTWGSSLLQNAKLWGKLFPPHFRAVEWSGLIGALMSKGFQTRKAVRLLADNAQYKYTHLSLSTDNSLSLSDVSLNVPTSFWVFKFHGPSNLALFSSLSSFYFCGLASRALTFPSLWTRGIRGGSILIIASPFPSSSNLILRTGRDLCVLTVALDWHLLSAGCRARIPLLIHLQYLPTAGLRSPRARNCPISLLVHHPPPILPPMAVLPTQAQ